MTSHSRILAVLGLCLGLSAAASASDTCPQTLDFDTDAYGDPIVAGQDLSEVYEAWGVTLVTYNTMAMDVPGLGIAFDSSDPPDHDIDLGTPNEAYGGPGVGEGGESNTVALGNLLISAENFVDADGDGLIDDPDDDDNGAWFGFHFDTPTCVLGLDLVDIESSEAPSDLYFYDSDGYVIEHVRAGGLGDNSVEVLELEICGVASTMFDIYGSGAIDNMILCPPTDICVEEAISDSYGSGSTHALWLPGIAEDLIFDPDSGVFTESADGTATFTGTVSSESDPTSGFSIALSLSGRTDTAPSGSPKLELDSSAYAPVGPIDTDTWYYYPDFSGVLTGVGGWEGAEVQLTRRGPAWQVGEGANGKNLNYGASAWLDYTVSAQPGSCDGGAYEGAGGGDCFDSTGNGDFNLDLVDCEGDEEVCNGLDDDGDSTIDEELPDADADGTCDGEDAEECDGMDNDGDGDIDEGFDVDGDGLADCFDPEECDGADNDGDGEVDEGLDFDGDGIANCYDTEECDGVDNDGDDSTDEGFDADSDGIADCLDEEECDGVDNDGDGEVDECQPDADGDGICDGLDDEVCNDFDDDGDGRVDEGLPDADADGTCDGADAEECDGMDNDGDGIDEGHDFDGDGTANCFDTEECDGVDNDGDGTTDEGFDADSDGVADCFDVETCDGIDNDADGAVDEGLDSDGDGIADCYDQEECDGVDNDGDSQIDEGFDADLDGAADCYDSEDCDLADNDGDGLVDEGVPDCDSCPVEPVAIDLGDWQSFNAVSFGDYVDGTDIAGKLAVAGDVTLDSFSVGAGTTGGDVLIAGGDMALSYGTVHGNAAYGGAYSADTVGYTHGGAPRSDSPLDFTALELQAQAAAATLAALEDRGSSVIQPWGAIELTGSDDTLNVFSFSCEELALAPSLSIDAPADSTVIVNITGETCSLDNLSLALTDVDRTDVLYNFYQATALTIENVSVQGTVLAPYAATTFNNGDFDGTLVAADLAGDGEFHDFPFDAQIVYCPTGDTGDSSCEVTWTETGSWSSGGGEGFQAEATVTWSGDPIDGWSFEWDFAGDESVESGWNGVFSQSDAHVTVTDDTWNAVLDDGGAITLGFTGSRTSASATPSGFTLNGVSCSDGSSGGGDTGGDSGLFE